MTKHKDFIYDLECYPNFFSFSAVYKNGKKKVQFEISDRKNQANEMLEFLRDCKRHDCRLVGFNNIGFDYPLLHFILMKSKTAIESGKEFSVTAKQIYKHMLGMFEKKTDDRFGSKVKDSDVRIPQVDLYLIHHFDNKARSTSLKMLEFNMRSDNIQELPIPAGTVLTKEQMQIVLDYNMHDVMETLKFYKYSSEALKLRDDLTELFGFDCTNFNDGKIGKQLFINSLEKERPGSCYIQTEHGRKMNQTKRSSIAIKDCIVPYVNFLSPEFSSLLKWFKSQVISETKGVFSDIEEHRLGELAKYSDMVVKKKKFKSKPDEEDIELFKSEHPMGWIEEQDLKATEFVVDDDGNHVMYQPLDDDGNPVGGLKKKRQFKKSYWGCWRVAETLNVNYDGVRYDLGVGGIHAAVSGTHVSNDEYVIITQDVASFYPNISIKNRIAPAHLGDTFCDVYSKLYDMRKSSPKGSAMNAALKLSLNSSYGDSNSEYSPLYDPQYTMSITCSGQMLLLMLIEYVTIRCGAKILMANTDGFEFMIKRSMVDSVNKCIKEWEDITKLTMEGDSYSVMYIRDVNNYISKTESGKVKLKGAYEFNDFDKHGWHKNHSAMVIAKAVKAHLVDGVDYEEFIRLHDDPHDFMLRTKVQKSSRLVLVVNGEDVPQQNICRYYPSKSGGKLIKIMPPLEGSDSYRRLGIDTDWNISTCNSMKDFNKSDIDYTYYIREAKKLIDAVQNQ